MVSRPRYGRPDVGKEKYPGRSHRPGHLLRTWVLQYLDLVTADVYETQAAPGLDVLVAISADVEGRAAVEMAVTMVMMAMTVAAVAMTVMSAVAMTTMPMTAMTARRSRGHRGSTEGESGDDGE